MSIPVVNGAIEVDGTAVAQVQEFTLDRTQDYGEVQSKESPLFAELIRDQKSWSATVTALLRANEGTDAGSTNFSSPLAAIETAYEEGNSVTLTLEYGGQSDFGELEYTAEIVEADAKIASLSDDGDFFASGETWTREIELTGENGFSVV